MNKYIFIGSSGRKEHMPIVRVGDLHTVCRLVLFEHSEHM